ncbi:hypothetical protein C5S30_03615 [ANME-1 cluster archaeon GoMg4]|nr:hypothetical protein [ANME-1 cluster archaeon GoMg4]
MRYKLEKYKWWILFIITLAVFSILSISDYANPNECPENARYILSAISQGLAAILALVFTITLVVSQMTRRYTAMDKIIFRPETISLMIVFGIGVVTPLLVLKFGFWRHGINLSIAIAFFCVFSLLPFLKGVNGVLKYEIGVVNLYEESMKAINLGDEAGADGRIGELTEIGKDAVNESCERVVVNIIRYLSQIVKKSAEKGWGNATFWVVDNLKDIGVDSVGRRFEEASFFAAKGLKDIGVEAAKNRLEALLEPVTVAIDGLKDIGAKAAEKGLKKWDITIRAAEGLRDIGMKSGDKDKYLAVNGLWCLGAFVTEYLPEQVDHVIQNLREMEKEIGKEALMSWGKNCISDYPNLKSSFEEFKRRYNER